MLLAALAIPVVLIPCAIHIVNRLFRRADRKSAERD